MKIFTAEQQQELDKETMRSEPISSLDLMERAAQTYTEALLDHVNEGMSVAVFCGPGNNGGDGLVIARLLDERNIDVSCCFVALSDKGSDEFEKNRERLGSTNVSWIELNSEHEIESMDIAPDIIIDSIFGTGLSRPAEGIAKTTIDKMNTFNCRRFAVDVPSGLYCNEPNNKTDTIFRADHTFTFHAPKLSFFYPEQGKYVGDFKVLDIGLDTQKSQQIEVNYFMLTKDDLKRKKKKRSRFSHKGTYGHAGVVAGSAEKMGAALLASEGALRSGAGLTTAYVPSNGSQSFNVRTPSIMLKFIGEDKCEVISHDEGVRYGLGPGLGTSESVIAALSEFLKKVDQPIVLDADALNIIADNKDLVNNIPSKTILTPHPREFERLCGEFKDSYERTELQRKFSQDNDVFIILKDAYTAISDPCGNVYFNPFGGSGMATGGSGDVLTGLITGLLAQGYTSEEAAQMGVGVHGMAGEIAEEKLGPEFMCSEDVLNNISEALQGLG